MGANDKEADAALTRKDFFLKYTIVRKETCETHFWLSFVSDTNILDSQSVEAYIKECAEIQNIVSSIVNNSLRN